jgi:hypothetical protein
LAIPDYIFDKYGLTMNSIEREIESFEQGHPVKLLDTKAITIRGSTYTLHAGRFKSGGQIRVWVLKDGVILGSTFDPAHNFNCSPGSPEETKIIQELFSEVTADIYDDPLGLY